jgi:hypothetical protein
MPSAAVLGTVIGLVFLFGLSALFCSAITEAVSNIFQMRAKYLLTAVRSMLDEPESSTTGAAAKATKTALHNSAKDPAETEAAAKALRATIDGALPPPPALPGGAVPVAAPAAAPDEPTAAQVTPGLLTLALFDHSLIKSLQTRRVLPFRLPGRLRNPQYLSSTLFVRALVDTLLPDAVDHPTGQQADASVLAKLNDAALALPANLPFRRSLLALIRQARGDMVTFEASLEAWYDEQMARIAGWYKRWAKVILGAVGLLLAILANIDTVQVAHGLYVDAPTRQSVLTSAYAGTLCQGATSPAARNICVEQEIIALRAEGLPIGYPSGCSTLARDGNPARCWSWSATGKLHVWDFPLKLFGWALTAFAVSFGAPFWFDALSKLGSLRNAGPKPAAAA